MKYVIVRSNMSGVWAGYLHERNGQEITLKNARRIWEWSGAASCSQLAVDGVSKPNECKFPCEVEEVMISEWVEIIPATDKSKNSIDKVPVWTE